ncbi:MAG: hypothetical protein H6791_01550 [Candidatus Nomurabacteria bacterium]|nr:MAG: hypothetical protein H6791_01550 [Candidatus Nomurabacteria bacterium]
MVKKDLRKYSDRREYLIKKVSERRKLLLDKTIEYKGGKCIVCKHNKCKRALVFHHLNPKEKSFGISSKGITRSWSSLQKELDKCVLLCANCHAEVHDGITQLPIER